MGYLIDTNVVSEHTRPRPNAAVLTWLKGIHIEEQHLSTLSLGEMRYGIERLTFGARREALRRWLDIDVVERFAERLLPVSVAVSERWGHMRTEANRTLPAVDSLIAATALHHDLRLVTRNDQDYRGIPGLIVVNPWRL